MKVEDVKDFILNADAGRTFIITLIDGSREKKRLFVHKEQGVCEYLKGSRKYGHPVFVPHIEKFWVSISTPKTDPSPQRFRKQASKVISYLTESGLWVDIKESLQSLLSQDNDTIEKLYKHAYTSQYAEMLKTVGVNSYLSPTILCNLFSVGAIKSMAFDKDTRSYNRNRLKDYYKTNTKQRLTWSGRYDYSVEYDGERKKAWYSEEYKGTGNGYYYLTLNNTHALFVEKD